MDTHHVGYRSSGKYDSADELADKVEAAVLVCDGHDDADGYEKEGGDGKGEYQTVPWEVDRVVLDYKDTNSKHCNKCGKIPTYRSVFVVLHQTTVDVFAAHASAVFWLHCRAATVCACRRFRTRHVGSYRLVLCFPFSGAFSERLFGLLPDILAMPAQSVRD